MVALIPLRLRIDPRPVPFNFAVSSLAPSSGSATPNSYCNPHCPAVNSPELVGARLLRSCRFLVSRDNVPPTWNRAYKYSSGSLSGSGERKESYRKKPSALRLDYTPHTSDALNGANKTSRFAQYKSLHAPSKSGQWTCFAGCVDLSHGTTHRLMP